MVSTVLECRFDNAPLSSSFLSFNTVRFPRPKIHPKTTMSYSPFDCLVVAAQTPSGLLQREDGEVDLLVVEDLEVRSANTEPMMPLDEHNQIDGLKRHARWMDRTSSLLVQITSHRIVLFQTIQGLRQGRYLHHSQIINVSEESAYFKSPKILLNTAALGDLLLVFPKDKSKLRDDCIELLKKALSRQEWEHRSNTEAVQAVARRRVGVDAILTQNALRHQQAAKLTDTAFTGDAETLLREAKDLVKVITKYVATLDRQQETDPETTQLVDMLQNMGMTSALSKANFEGKSSAYIDTVARELADFMRPRFSEQVPVYTLTDVYCLFNRARGSHLLSPEDITLAAKRCRGLRLGLSVSTFPSGLMVLQYDELAGPAKLQPRLRKLLKTLATDSLTAMDLSRQWKISAVLAAEQLESVEKTGYLVRDETLESLRFYLNRFNEVEAS